MAKLEAASEQLDAAWQRLERRWQDSKAVWNDRVRWHFEEEFWLPLAEQVPATQREMERLAKLIAQAQRNVK